MGALRSLRSKKKLSAEKWLETQFLANEAKEKWIEDYVESETAVARERVEDAETAIMEEQNDMTNVESAGTTTRTPKTTFEAMLNAMGDSLSDLASSKDDQDGKDEEDDEEDTQLGKLSDDDEPGWVMGTITKTVEHCMESFRQKQMTLNELMQPGWGDAANNFSERDLEYGTAGSKVPAVVKPQIDTTAASPPLKTFEEHTQTLDIVHGQSAMWAVTSRPGSSQMRLGSEKPQLQKFLLVHSPDAARYLTLIEDVMPVDQC